MVEELGFHTEVGLGPPRAEDRNKNANLEHSIGYRVQRIKGHFVTPSEQPHALTAIPSDWNQLYRRSEEGVASATHCLTADCERSPRVCGTVGFKYFPYDCQSLLVRIRASGDNATIYSFEPSSSIGVHLSGTLRSETTTTLAGWSITAINHQERLYTSKPMFDLDMGTSNPLYAVLTCA